MRGGFVGCKGGYSFRGGLDHLLKSQPRGGVSLTIGRHQRYIPLSGLSVLWHLVGDLRVSCTPSMESFVTACPRLKGLLYSINGGFWLMYVIDLWVSCTPSMESFVTVCPKLKSLLYSFEMEFVTACPRWGPVRACLWPSSTKDRNNEMKQN